MRSRDGCAALIAALALGAPTPAPALGLGGPEVFKVDWNTRGLTACDVDRDERVDLVLLNNGRAKIDILYQRKPDRVDREQRRASRKRTWEPLLEDARFRHESVVTGIRMYALAAGDLDGNGLADFAFTGNPDGLTVLFQGPRGAFNRRQVFESESPNQWGGTLSIADLDADGRPELIALMESELLVYARGERDELAGARRYPLADDGAYGLVVEDVDRDGLADLTYLVAKNSYPWRVRFQRPGGGFGPERAFRIQAPRRDLQPLRLGDRPVFASVQNQTGLIEMLELEKTTAGSERATPAPRVYSTPTADNVAGSYALGDLDGDGLADVTVADRKGAQVWLYRQREDGTFAEPEAYPSLSDARSIAAGDADGDGRAELFVASPGEEAVGLSRLTPSGRLEYPSLLPVDGKPIAVAAYDLDRDGRDELACLVEREGDRAVSILERGDAADAWTEQQRIELTGLRADPTDLEVHDANQDGRPDLAVFVVRSPLHLLVQTDEGRFEDVSLDETFRRGLVDGLTPVGLSSGDVDGDGKDDLIVAGSGYARALRLTGGATIEVVDQFNANDREAELAAALPVDLDGDATPEVLLIHEGGERIEVLERDGRGVYRHRSSSSVGEIGLVQTLMTDLGRNGGTHLLLLGTDRFWSVPFGGDDLRARSIQVHEADLDDVVYVELRFGDLDGDGAQEMVALDTRETRTLEVLSWTGEVWESRLHFPVFDADPHYQGRQGAANEPREMLLADLTSDGRPDVALLVHDRVLVYPAR